MALQSALFRGDVKSKPVWSTTPRTSKLALSANMSRKFKLLSQRLTGLPSLETSYQDERTALPPRPQCWPLNVSAILSTAATKSRPMIS